MSPRARFIALLSADIGSTLGSRISLVAIPWLVLTLTGSATDVGLVATAEFLPYLLSAMLLTPLADRYGLRASSVLCDLFSALATGGIAAYPHQGVGSVMALVAVAGALRGVGDRTKHVLLRPAAKAAGYSTIRVTSLYEGLARLTILLGAPVGGLLIVWFGARGAVWVDAASFAFCAVLVAGFVAIPRSSAKATEGPGERYLPALRSGFLFLWRDRVLATMLGTVFVLNVFSNAANVVFLPVWADEVLHSPEALGLTLGVFAAGTLIGTLVLGVLAPRLPQYLTFLLGAVISGAPRLFVLGLSSNLPLVLVVSLISGFGLASVNPILGVAMYERIPDRLQGRVIGLCTTVCFAGVPIGTFFGGLSVTTFGLRATLVGGAVGCLLLTLAPLLGRRDYSVTAEPDAATVPAEPAAVVPAEPVSALAAEQLATVPAEPVAAVAAEPVLAAVPAEPVAAEQPVQSS